MLVDWSESNRFAYFGLWDDLGSKPGLVEGDRTEDVKGVLEVVSIEVSPSNESEDVADASSITAGETSDSAEDILIRVGAGSGSKEEAPVLNWQPEQEREGERDGGRNHKMSDKNKKAERDSMAVMTKG